MNTERSKRKFECYKGNVKCKFCKSELILEKIVNYVYVKCLCGRFRLDSFYDFREFLDNLYKSNTLRWMLGWKNFEKFLRIGFLVLVKEEKISAGKKIIYYKFTKKFLNYFKQVSKLVDDFKKMNKLISKLG